MVAVLDTAALTGFHRGLFSVSAEDDCVYLIADAGAIPLPRTRVLTTLDDAELSPIGADWGPMLMAPASPVAVGNTQFEGRLGGLYHGESGKFFIDGAHGLIAGPVVFDMMREVLDSRITFTGDNKRTYFDSAGVMQTATTNVPRFNYEYNGTSWVAAGLLIEPAATNLLLRSTAFNTGWTASGATVTGNSTTAPDGTTTADTIVENASTSTHGVYQAATLTAATYTYSVFAKAGTRSWLFLTCTPSSAFGAYFNLSDGTVGTVTAGYTATISAVGNGWYRCAISFTATAATWYSNVLVATSNGTSSYTGDGASGLYAWGAQLEAGSVATSFIETTTATATRAADVASITGSNFSSWFNPVEGTFVAEFTPALVSDQSTVFSVSDGTTNERMHSSAGGSIHFYVVDGGAAQVSIDAGSHVANTSRKIAAAYKVNDFAASINGGAAVADTSGTLPTVDRLNIGSFTSGNLQLNGHIARITYSPTAYYGAALQSLTV